MAVRKRTRSPQGDDSIATGDLDSVRKAITEVNLDHPAPKSRGLTQRELMDVVGEGAIEIARKHRKGVHPGQLPLDFDKENTMAQAKKKVTKKAAPAAATKAKAKPEAETKKKAAPAKESEDNLVTLAQLAEEVGITPSVARRKLRGFLGEAREEKTRYVWKADSKELAKIRTHLTAAA